MLLTVMSISFGVSPALALVVFLASDTHVALIVFAAQSFAMSLWLSPYYTSQQELAGARYRATASAFGLIFFNVIGAGLGPLIVGSLSDVLATRFGDQSLRYAMAICLIFCLWGLAHIRVASRTMAADVADARS
jgi:MFS family permease